jgi:hypothetical protein
VVSTRVARRAGRYVASIAVASSTTGTIENVSASVAAYAEQVARHFTPQSQGAKQSGDDAECAEEPGGVWAVSV